MSPRCNDIFNPIYQDGYMRKSVTKIHCKDIVKNTSITMCSHFKTLRWSARITRQNILKNITASKVIKEGGLLDPWSKAGLIGKIYKSI